MPDPSFETFLTSRDLNSLRQIECHILVKNWIFGDPIHKKWSVLVILVLVMIRPSGSEFFCEEISIERLVRPVRLQRPLRSIRLKRFLMPGKSLLRASESSRFLNSLIWGLYFNVLKKKIFWQNHQNSCWILAPFLSEVVEAVWGQKSLKWWIRHKFPLLRKPLSISFW